MSATGRFDSSGVRPNRRVQWGDTVRVDFMVWLEDGTLIDSSIYNEPLIFTAGAHAVIRGVECLVIGMSIGESKTEKIPSESAFGPYRPELSCVVSLDWLRAQAVVPTVGLGLEVQEKNGSSVRMFITGVDGDRVKLDANHRLAGRNLMVQLDLLEILDQFGSSGQEMPASAAG